MHNAYLHNVKVTSPLTPKIITRETLSKCNLDTQFSMLECIFEKKMKFLSSQLKLTNKSWEIIGNFCSRKKIAMRTFRSASQAIAHACVRNYYDARHCFPSRKNLFQLKTHSSKNDQENVIREFLKKNFKEKYVSTYLTHLS